MNETIPLFRKLDRCWSGVVVTCYSYLLFPALLKCKLL
jgi:hypothetical protein